MKLPRGVILFGLGGFAFVCLSLAFAVTRGIGLRVTDCISYLLVLILSYYLLKRKNWARIVLLILAVPAALLLVFFDVYSFLIAPIILKMTIHASILQYFKQWGDFTVRKWNEEPSLLIGVVVSHIYFIGFSIYFLNKKVRVIYKEEKTTSLSYQSGESRLFIQAAKV
jgi:hypothetical protein